MIWIGIIMAAAGYVCGFIYYWREAKRGQGKHGGRIAAWLRAPSCASNCTGYETNKCAGCDCDVRK